MVSMMVRRKILVRIVDGVVFLVMPPSILIDLSCFVVENLRAWFLVDLQRRLCNSINLIVEYLYQMQIEDPPEGSWKLT